MERASERWDVVVVGAGSAAFQAAIAARQGGADRVVMLEKAPEPEFGGNARFSHTGFRFVHSGRDEIRAFLPDVDEETFSRMEIRPYTEDDFLADLNRVTRNRIDPVLARTLVEHSNRAVHWMLETGIRFEPDAQAYAIIDGRYYFEPGRIIQPVGGGIGQLTQWRDIALGLGIEVRYESRVAAIHGNARRVEGVRVTGSDGEDYDLLADAVILCAGGFQASTEMRAKYLGTNADLMKVRGSRHDTGEVLQMAIALGAKSAGHWQGAHATPIDANFPDVELSNRANRYSYMFGITVNSVGQRFFDEGEAEHSYTYAKTGWAVLGQPGAVAYQIFDQKGLQYLIKNRYVFAEPIEAPTIEELAVKLGIEPVVLAHTVREYNQSIRTDIPFDPTRRDGRCTEGIQPRKSNWSLAIDEPPFTAYPVTCGITFTFGGLQVDPTARVLDTGGRPIEGLYASGDIVGLFYHNYPSCSGQTRNVVFSTLAGQHATQRSRASA